MVQPPANLRSFQALRQVVEALRGPDGCPWDKEQNHRTLTPFAIEEAFELVEAIESGSQDDLIEELGDYLLQVILHAEIARQEKRFTLEDVIESINKKMIRRHPHVFGDTEVQDSNQVLENWSVIKAQEKAKPTHTFALPDQLPALQKSQKIGSKTQNYGFDWEQSEQVWAKIEEELSELKEAVATKNRPGQESELGDVFFSLAQWARHQGFEAEGCLRETNRRFEKRFFAMLKLAEQQGQIGSNLDSTQQRQAFRDLKPALKEQLWSEVKRQEREAD